jgi:integrase
MASFKKRGDTWSCRIRRKGHEQLTRTFDTKADAERWALSVESKMSIGVYEDTREVLSTTLKECLERYQVEVTALKKGASQENYRVALWLRDELSSKPIGVIKSADVAKWRDLRLAAGVSSGTVRLDLALLSHVFTVAIQEWSMPLVNPVKNVRKPKAAKERDRVLLPGEEERLLDTASDEMRVIIVLAIETAMRRSEIVGLRREWIKGKIVTLPDTKNGTVRRVPLSSRAFQALALMPVKLDGSVFNYTEHGVTEMFGKYCKRLGIKDLHFHDLRHTATTNLFGKGLTIMEVKAITGHKSMQMLARYTHINANDLLSKLG